MKCAAIEKPIRKPLRWMTGIIMTALLATTVSPLPAHALEILTGCGGGDFGADCSLAELVAGGSIQIDNSLFDDWSFSGNGLSSNSISVTPIGEGTSNPGPGIRLAAPGISSDADFSLNYDVSTIDFSITLDDYTLDMAVGQIVGNASGFAAMEVVDNDSGNEIACGGLLPCDEPVVTESNSTKSDVFTDEVSGFEVLSKDFNVTTNMLAFVGSGESFEFIVIEQSFSHVPEPTTALLLGAGLLGVAGLFPVSRSRTHG